MIQAIEIIINIYDDTLANWHPLNEKSGKTKTCRMTILPLSCTGSHWSQGTSRLDKIN